MTKKSGGWDAAQRWYLTIENIPLNISLRLGLLRLHWIRDVHRGKEREAMVCLATMYVKPTYYLLSELSDIRAVL